MNKLLLLLICTILAGGQAAAGAAPNGESSSPPAIKMYYGNVDFTRTLPESGTGTRQPISLVDGTAMYVNDYGIDEVNRLAKEGILIGSDSEDNYINLEHGNVLLNPEKDTLIGTSHGKISIGPGSTVFIMQSTNSLVVYDISQTQPQQITVTVNGKAIVLESGRMFVLTRENTRNFEKLNINCHAVTYSNVQSLDLDNNIKAFLANFSVASALVTIEPLKRLTVSHNRRDKLALEQLVNNARLSGDTMISGTMTSAFVNTIDKSLEVADNSH